MKDKYMQTRLTNILNVLGQEKRISVAELSEKLKVSEVTIRKDLSKLEDKGLLKREHGFAAIVTSDDVNNRLLFNYEIKKKIAQKAAASIRDGETIMIESGSCCALLAEEVVTSLKDVTIITNSVFIASFVRSRPGAHIILLGGAFQNEAQVMVGPLIKKCAENFHVGKFFIGTDGFNDIGAMSADLMRAEAVRSMSESAQQTIILTESQKFNRSGVVSLLPYDKINAIYTDDKIGDDKIKSLQSKNIKVHI